MPMRLLGDFVEKCEWLAPPPRKQVANRPTGFLIGRYPRKVEKIEAKKLTRAIIEGRRNPPLVDQAQMGRLGRC
jgi:hypothetical protein